MQSKKIYRHNYISNSQFYDACTEYIYEMRICREAGLPDPRISEYIGKCFLDIATHMAYRHNFREYSWVDEMVGDSVLNCIQALPSFKPEVAKRNAFGYFSLIIFRAFVRRIKTENLKTKTRLQICEFLDIDLEDENSFHGSDTYLDLNDELE